MRISDWSSYVFSSDLYPAIEHTSTPPGMAVVDQTLEFLLLVRSRLRHYEYPCEPGHYLPGWISILITDACRGQIGNHGFYRRGYFGIARDEATRTAPLPFDHALHFNAAAGLPNGKASVWRRVCMK